MNKSYLLIIAAGLCLAACNKEAEIVETPDSPDSGKMITETITASLGTNTKVTIAGGGAFAWTINDNIAVHVSKGDTHEYVTTTSGASVAEASASFTVTYGEGYTRDAFAIFPSTIVSASAANYGQSESTLDVSLPATYTLAEVSDVAPCPMIADNTGSGWGFYHLCGLLRLTVNSIPSDATGIVIQFPGKKVNGAFSIASPVTPGTSTITTGTPASGEDQITVTFAKGTTSVTINLPLPTGDYDHVFITPAGSSTKVAAVRHINVDGYTAQAAHGKKLTATMVSFSVAADKKVVFAPANLVATIGADYASTKWFFHANQYDMVYTESTKNGSPKQSFAVDANFDLFGWVGASCNAEVLTGNAEWGITGNNTVTNYGGTVIGVSDPLKHDWGESSIGGYATNFWSTPSISEWEYVIRTRPNARFAKASLFGTKTSGRHGIIVFPDTYVHPDGIATPVGINVEDETYINGNNYTKAEWDQIEAAGAIFLPSAGYRTSGSTLNHVNYSDMGTEPVDDDLIALRYWSCSPYVPKEGDDLSTMGKAYRFLVNAGSINFSLLQPRTTGMSVRLIREL